jgi:hypothetical protein
MSEKKDNPNDKQPCCCSCSPESQSSCDCSTEAEMLSPPLIRDISGSLTWADRCDHVAARWGYRRMHHRVPPGLYRLGSPAPDAPVFASANYTLSFDALRSSLAGTDCFILVLDTKGINVWCAAGKGTFGTDELVHRIAVTRLSKVVRHRTVIVPQLGAPGIAAHEVLRRSGFRVQYGPVRASDLPEYLATGGATPEMRRIEFPLRDRIVLIPVELVQALPLTLLAAVLLGVFVDGWAGLRVIVAVGAGTVLFPALLPVLPTKDFTTKGLFLGVLAMLPFAAMDLSAPAAGILSYLQAAAGILLFPAVTAYLALNFTGCTPYTSRSGVRREIFRYTRVLAGMALGGIALAAIIGIKTVVNG